MDKRAYYKMMFWIGGIWNIAMSIPIWIMGVSDAATFDLFGITAPQTMFFFHAMMWFVAMYGLGYIIVGRDIDKNHGIVVIGALAKIAFFIDSVATFASMEAGIIVVLIGAVDLLFAVLFIEFLLWIKKNGGN